MDLPSLNRVCLFKYVVETLFLYESFALRTFNLFCLRSGCMNIRKRSELCLNKSPHVIYKNLLVTWKVSCAIKYSLLFSDFENISVICIRRQLCKAYIGVLFLSLFRSFVIRAEFILLLLCM